jgi:hypothetical protein
VRCPGYNVIDFYPSDNHETDMTVLQLTTEQRSELSNCAQSRSLRVSDVFRARADPGVGEG